MRVELLAVVAVLSCSGEPPSDLGVAITAPGTAAAAPLGWSREGQEVFYLSEEGLEAADAQGSGASRVIDHGPGARRGLVSSPDGARLYFLHDGALRWVATEPGGARGEIARDVDAYALAPSGGALAWSAGGEIRLLQGGTSFHVGRGHPLLFAPDGARLLCGEEPSIAEPLFAMDLAGGDSVPLTLVLAPGEQLRAARWDGGGIHLLIQGIDEGELFVLDETTGLRRQVYRHAALQDALLGGQVGFGPDARTAYAWTSRCIEAGAGFMTCASTRYDLHAIDTVAGEDRVIASGVGEGAGGFAVSPDGGRIAFVLSARVWVRSL